MQSVFHPTRISSILAFIIQLFIRIYINIKCYDDFSWFHKNESLYSYYPIRHAKYISPDYDAEVLLLIWPPPNTNMASHTLSLFKGNILVYIGEIHEKICFDCNTIPNPINFDKDTYWVKMNKPPPDIQKNELYI